MHRVNYYESVPAAVGAGAVNPSCRFSRCREGRTAAAGPGRTSSRPWPRWNGGGSRAPHRIDHGGAVNNRVERTRRLCPYPATAHYTGTGSTNDAGNFVCKAP